eukprot:1458498-Pleurochrysis_carterae.AAC.1
MARHTPVCNPFWCTCPLRATRRFVPLRETSPCSARSGHVFGGESLALRAEGQTHRCVRTTRAFHLLAAPMAAVRPNQTQRAGAANRRE